jgi:raffinose/stachyose/melibiose transport system substrate-binding protein
VTLTTSHRRPVALDPPDTTNRVTERLTMTYPHLRQRQRRAAAVAVPLVAGMLLAACGSGDSGSSGGKEPQTITFTYAPANAQDNSYEVLAKDYEAAHSGVTIKLNKINAEAVNSTLTTQMQAGNGPDVMALTAGSGQAATVGQFAKAGLLLELTDPSFDQNVPETEQAGYLYQDKLYGVPSSTAVAGIVYNDELAKSSGVTLDASSTLEDVLAACKTAREKGQSVFGLAGSIPVNTGIMTVEIATSTVYGPEPDWNQQRADGKVTFAKSQGWKDALQTVVDLNKNGCFQDGAAGAGFDALTNGATAGSLYGFFAPSGAVKSIQDASGGHVTLIALPFPAPEGSDTYAAVTSDLGLAGNAKTKSPKLVEDFLKFSVSPEEAKKYAEAAGTIPIGSDITSSDLLPQYQPVAPLIADDKVRPFAVDEWPNGQVYDALGTGVTGLLTGQKTINDVLEAMDAAWGS